MNKLLVLSLMWLPLVCSAASAFASSPEQLERDLRAALPNDRAGVVIGYINPEAETTAFLGNPTFSAQTLFEYGSVTKVLTAVLLSELAAEGEVALTDNLNAYLPKAAQDEKWRDVTLQDLATHNAGLPRLPTNMTALYMFRNRGNPYAAYNEVALFEGIEETQLEPVGEFNAYSNFGFGLLGTLLERATGTPYQTLVETRIFEPLGMTGATLTGWSSTAIAPPLTRSGGAAAYWDFDALAGAGAARGSLTDALKFLKASMTACGTSSKLAEANCRAQQATQVKAFEDAAQGLGWIRLESPAGEIVWHNGATGGYSSFLGFNVRTGKGLVVLANVGELEEVTNLSLEFLAGLE